MEAELSVRFVENTPAGTEGYAEVFVPLGLIVLKEFEVETPKGVRAVVEAETWDGKVGALKITESSGKFKLEKPIWIRKLWLKGITKNIITEAKDVKFKIYYDLIELEPWQVGLLAVCGVSVVAGLAYLVSERR